MEETIKIIEQALAACERISPDTVEKTACKCHLVDAKRHLENRIKHNETTAKAEAAKPVAK